MTSHLPGPSVPPHLRKRTAKASQPKADVRLGDCLVITTPPASDEARVDEPARVEKPVQVEKPIRREPVT